MKDSQKRAARAAGVAAGGTRKVMNIVFLGPPGSGKGTQSKRIAETQDVIHLSTGDMFRDAIGSQSELGREVQSYVDSGKLVPDELVSEVVFEKLKSLQGKGFLLDGYPRTVEQARAFDDFIGKNGIAINLILSLDVDADALIKRLSSRRFCPTCGEVYNLETRPPREATRCDIDGAELSQRQDDKAEVVQQRIHVYQVQTAPVADHYKDQPNFRSIDGSQDIDRVFAEITSVLQEFRGSGQ